ncbi:MAG TPA: hypothetical protein GX505_07000 [Clostridiales bacterium]|nr:hypothetical protein [Clostridiales bacterium]
MNNRERAMAILNYRNYDRLPIVHFGFWEETLEKWCNEGHLKQEEIENVWDGSEAEKRIAEKLGFDFNWYTTFGANTNLFPSFETKILEELPDGFIKVLNSDGVIVLQKKGIASIPSEVDYLLKSRKEWEEHYLPKLQFSEDRINKKALEKLKDDSNRDIPIGLHCGSLFGNIRNWLTVVGASYLYADDEELYTEIIDTVGELCYRCAEYILSSGAKFDFAHFWEDICFKSGPLVIPRVFEEKVGPHYRRITDLVRIYGINIISLDCDGKIDALVPIWLNNGVNTMFPIEVGTWDGNIKPWREEYGKELRGVGGMDKKVFAKDYAAVDAEIERLKPLVELGGYIPCPDHRIPPDAKWENIQYYCDRMRKVFG